MWISKMVCLFMIYSFMGWAYETAYCTIKNGKWENRGFLYGPVCPIYGTGALAVSLLIRFTGQSEVILNGWQLFALCVIGSAGLEYVTSWTLERLFHAVWWDYSRLPFNIQGRISLFTSLGFGFGGLLVVDKISPFTEDAVRHIPTAAVELLALLLVFLFAVDITLTVTILLHFDQMVRNVEESFNQNMDHLVDSAISKANHMKQSVIETGNYTMEQIYSLSKFARQTIRRVYTFRDKDKKRENRKNQLLKVIDKITRRNASEKDTTKNSGQ